MFHVVCLAHVSLALHTPAPAPAPCNADTLQLAGLGPIEGVVEGAVRFFRGVPYAAPPLGNLRFRRPQPPAPWNTPPHNITWNATKFGHTCPQMGQGTKTGGAWPSIGGLPTASENCLFMNVYTPSTCPPSTLLPVLVYLHAGEFIYGSGFDTENLVFPQGAFGGDVMVVTFNYRISSLGFLALPEFAEPPPPGSRTHAPPGSQPFSHHQARAMGNYGLFDQQMALKFVHDHIAVFGGDPTKVTIFGESSGGTAVAFHLVNPPSWPYFSRAILESPGLTQVQTLERTVTNSKYVVNAAFANRGKAFKACTFNGSHVGRLRIRPKFMLIPGRLTSRIPCKNAAGQTMYIPPGSTVAQAEYLCQETPGCLGFSLVNKAAAEYLNGPTMTTPYVLNSSTVVSKGAAPMACYGLHLSNPWETDPYVSLVLDYHGAIDSNATKNPTTVNNISHCLRTLTTGAMMEIDEYLPYTDSLLLDQYGPLMDGATMNRSLIQSFSLNKVKPDLQGVLLGSNKDEGTNFRYDATALPCSATTVQLQSWLESTLRLSPNQTLAAVSLYNRTLEQPTSVCFVPKKPNHTRGYDIYIRALGDYSVTCPTRHLATLLHPPVFLYAFAHQPFFSFNAASMSSEGAFHGSEVPFVFNATGELKAKGERLLSNAMQCYWSNFAWSGDPNNPGDRPGAMCKTLLQNKTLYPQWPRFNNSAGTGVNIRFDLADANHTRITMDTGRKQQLCEILKLPAWVGGNNPATWMQTNRTHTRDLI